MGTEIHHGAYKDMEAVYLENETLSACFMPECGGKMAGLTHRPSGREFLVQAEGERYLPLAYDGVFVDAECSGFDDMFPTIDPGYYELLPWRGAALPDHGEVCGLPWECSVEDGALSMQVHGVRLPYLLKKTAYFQDGGLRIDYCCQNLSPFDMDFLWAAHLMLNAEEGGAILVPYKAQAEAVCVFSWDEGFGKYGDSLTWPEFTGRDGKPRRLDATEARNPCGNNYKYFFKEPVLEGRCGYRYPDGTMLTVSFDQRTVPYLGIWANEGSFKGYHSIALEPCTGAWDRPDRARFHEQYSVLPAGGRVEWFMVFAATNQLRGV